MCVDRDHDLQWVVDQGYLPSKYLDRYLHIHADVLDLTVDDIWAAVVERWPTAAWEEVCHVHASPSCRSHSRANRGRLRHHDGQGRPCSELAKADDRACTHAIALIRAIQRRAPAALYTIEQPVNKTFCKVLAVAALRRAPGWRWLTGSYCRMTCDLDAGDWPRKDTNFWCTVWRPASAYRSVQKTVRICSIVWSLADAGVTKLCFAGIAATGRSRW